MTRWSQDQLDEFNVRRGSWIKVDEDLPDNTPERVLQAKCLKYLKEKGYPVWHDWSRKKYKAGFPDLIIFMDNGRVEMIELKAAAGRLRKEQQHLHRNLMFLGHSVHVVKSFKKFIEIMKPDVGKGDL